MQAGWRMQGHSCPKQPPCAVDVRTSIKSGMEGVVIINQLVGFFVVKSVHLGSSGTDVRIFSRFILESIWSYAF